MSKSRILLAAAMAAVFGFASNAHAADVTGAGASFIYPVMTQWSADYAKATGNKVNYQSIGSGGGIAQIKAGTVDFGSSDAPLKPEDLEKAGLAQFPSVIGGVVPVINVPGVASGALKLDGELLADIFLGKVTRWNDPRIVALNAGVKLPDRKITVVHRSDGSGTTFNFVNYLSKVSGEWKASVGEGTSVKWPVGIGGKSLDEPFRSDWPREEIGRPSAHRVDGDGNGRRFGKHDHGQSRPSGPELRDDRWAVRFLPIGEQRGLHLTPVRALQKRYRRVDAVGANGAPAGASGHGRDEPPLGWICLNQQQAPGFFVTHGFGDES